MGHKYTVEARKPTDPCLFDKGEFSTQKAALEWATEFIEREWGTSEGYHVERRDNGTIVIWHDRADPSKHTLPYSYQTICAAYITKLW